MALNGAHIFLDNVSIECMFLLIQLHNTIGEYWIQLHVCYLYLYSVIWPYIMMLTILYFILQSMKQNSSIYIHVFFTKSGYSPDPRERGKYAKKYTVSMSKSEYDIPS